MIVVKNFQTESSMQAPVLLTAEVYTSLVPMLMQCDVSCAEKYSSQSQRARVISERWFQANGYCLACENDRLHATDANTRATDFLCPVCGQCYELKAFRVRPTRTLVDGAYASLMARIMDGSVPTLMMLERNDLWEISRLTAIHHVFLTPEVIVRRKPLSALARRAGWVGCNIKLDRIAKDAQIEVVQQAVPNDRTMVRARFQQFERLKEIAPDSRGWATLTLQSIRGLGQETFSLSLLYAQEPFFASVYPRNKNIRPKIRQQLQVLRDLGFVEFCGQGTYRVLL
jgi:type II restriction enzyme